MEFAFQVAVGIGGSIVLPLMFALFAKFNGIRKEMDAEQEKRQQLELMIAREYVSRLALREIMEPFNSKLIHLDRMIERIASRLHVPAIGDN